MPSRPLKIGAPTIDRAVRADLAAVYEEIMWLASRPNVTPSMARAWYTHVAAGRFSRRIRHFSGKVSRAAVASTVEDPTAALRLEHHARIQTALTQLVQAHKRRKRPAPAAFARLVLACEHVHLVTFAENYAALRHRGDYRKAGIQLVAWRRVPKEVRQVLWPRMLRGRVANAADFRP